MKAHLAFDYPPQNHVYQKPLWMKAVAAMGWQESTINKADFIVMWGPNKEFDIARASNLPVLMVDFPYWNRCGKIKTGTESYKISVNGQHPTPYLMTENHDDQRYIAIQGPPLKPWRESGDFILIAGMGIKAATQFGFRISEWEYNIAERIRRHTSRPMVYRPKPGQKPYDRIPYTHLDDGQFPIEQALANAHAVVCHHGNPTVHALAKGVPIFMEGNIGAASHLSNFDLSQIESPKFFDNRQQFFNNISHWQWSVDEIVSGKALQSYHDRGFI